METHWLRHSRVGAILRGMREKRGLTQHEFSRRLGKPDAFVSMYENGQRRLDVLEFCSITRELRIDTAKTLRELDPTPRTRGRATTRNARPADRSRAKKQESKSKAATDTTSISCHVQIRVDRK